MGDIGQTYADGRERITELVREAPTEQLTATVPACPQWRVTDVVAHLAGTCSDVLAGNIEGVATDPWTAAQVEARRGRSIDELLEEWTTAAPQVEAIAQHFPGRVGTQWILDMTTHEHDIRGALGAPGAQDSSAVAMALEFMVGGLGVSVASRGLPPLEVRADGVSWIVGGEGETDLNAVLFGAEPPVNTASGAETTVEASGFELFRALTGRRSRGQIRKFTWTGDAEAYLPAFEFGPFRTATADVVE
ncbi:MAG: maleylpyruvate isomerase family mycothiol-dependent enzyme [Actinobacteria bacterium]|nr:maleylpyruvate isomerase family mycothiol-dependent enzyme [Actinomycetota bacterium]